MNTVKPPRMESQGIGRNFYSITKTGFCLSWFTVFYNTVSFDLKHEVFCLRQDSIFAGFTVFVLQVNFAI